jgi:hypothetical protein
MNAGGHLIVVHPNLLPEPRRVGTLRVGVVVGPADIIDPTDKGDREFAQSVSRPKRKPP